MEMIKEKELSKYLNSKLNKLKLEKIKLREYEIINDHLIISFWGGLNGGGKWKDYIKEIESIINEYEDSWVVDLENDCPDDLWYLRLGYRIKDFERFFTKELKNIIKKTNNLERYVVKVMEGCSYIILGNTQFVDEEDTKKIVSDKEIGMIIKIN